MLNSSDEIKVHYYLYKIRKLMWKHDLNTHQEKPCQFICSLQLMHRNTWRKSREVNNFSHQLEGFGCQISQILNQKAPIDNQIIYLCICNAMHCMDGWNASVFSWWHSLEIVSAVGKHFELVSGAQMSLKMASKAGNHFEFIWGTLVRSNESSYGREH